MIINSIGSGGGGVKLPTMTTPASPDKVLAGYETINQDGTIQIGTIETIGVPEPNVIFDDTTGVVTANVKAGPGYLDTENDKSTTFDIPTVDISVPTVSMNETGLITATNVQTKGYIKETGSVSATMQLTTCGDGNVSVDDNGTISVGAGYYPQTVTKQLTTRDESDVSVSTSGVISVPSGYYPSSVTKTLESKSASDITISGAGVITVPAGFYGSNVTKRLTTQSGITITPSTNAQYIYSGRYLTGNIVVSGDTNLKAQNIKTGVSIFGVSGTCVPGIAITLTVNTSANAYVTATQGSEIVSGTANSGGVCVLNLTKGGTWSVKAASSSSSSAATSDPVSVTVTTAYTKSVTRGGSAVSVTVPDNYTVTLGDIILKLSRYSRYSDSFGGGYYYCSATFGANYPQYRSSDDRDGFQILIASGAHGYLDDMTHYGYFRCIYYGTRGITGSNLNTKMPVARSGHSAASLSNTFGTYSFFAGGFTGKTRGLTPVANVDCLLTKFDYNTSYAYSPIQPTSHTVTALSTARSFLAGTYNYDNHVVMFGGGFTSQNAASSAVELYNSDLNKVTCTSLSQARGDLAAGHIDKYILFAGGANKISLTWANNSTITAYNTVNAYNCSTTSYTRTQPTALGLALYRVTSAHAGNYVLFAGGFNPSQGASNQVYAYNKTLVRTIAPALCMARGNMYGVTVGKYYAIFAGGENGMNGSTSEQKVYGSYRDVYNRNLTKIEEYTDDRYTYLGKCGCTGESEPYGGSSIIKHGVAFYGGSSTIYGGTGGAQSNPNDSFCVWNEKY